MRMYTKVSGLATWSENCKWYSSLPLGAVVLLFCEFCHHNSLCYFSMTVYCYCLFHYRPSLETFEYTLILCNMGYEHPYALTECYAMLAYLGSGGISIGYEHLSVLM